LAKDVQKQNAAGANLVLPLVVYDLPERDCAALSSNGELSLANNGSALYQEYIDNIAAQIKAFPDVTFVLIIGEYFPVLLETDTDSSRAGQSCQSGDKP
jgi:cellulose 1,4-beta-cellobiosidase